MEIAMMGPEIGKSALIIVDMQNDFVHSDWWLWLHCPRHARGGNRHAISYGHDPPGEAPN